MCLGKLNVIDPVSGQDFLVGTKIFFIKISKFWPNLSVYVLNYVLKMVLNIKGWNCSPFLFLIFERLEPRCSNEIVFYKEFTLKVFDI